MKGKAPGQGAGGARQPPERLAVGRIVRPHGVRGRLVAEPYSDLLESLRWVESGRIRPVVSHAFPLQEAGKAQRLMEKNEVMGKMVLVPEA